jgi:hypothetical protein
MNNMFGDWPEVEDPKRYKGPEEHLKSLDIAPEIILGSTRTPTEPDERLQRDMERREAIRKQLEKRNKARQQIADARSFILAEEWHNEERLSEAEEERELEENDEDGTGVDTSLVWSPSEIKFGRPFSI